MHGRGARCADPDHRAVGRGQRALHVGRGLPALVTEILVKAALAYLLGSIVGSLLIGRLRGGIDIRHLGSGNAGATNALRTQSKAFAFWVLLIDIGKGWIAT